MNDITVFEFKANPVRTVLIENEPWFVAKDVCFVLGLSKYRDAIMRLSSSQRASILVDTPGGKQEMSAVNEAGLYKLMFASNKSDAIQFADWVTSDVLPAIRKTGSYSLNSTEITSDFLQRVTNQLREKEQQIKELKPKADFFDAVANSKTAIQIGDVAKILAIPGIGRNNLFQILREKKILMQDNVPYQTYIDRGYFRVIEQKYNTPEGETRISIKTLVYQSGVEYIRKIVAQADNEMANNARRMISKALPSREVATV